MICLWLLRKLVNLKLWNDDTKNKIIANNGSVQAIPDIPADVKAIYKTIWEILQKRVLDLAADRGAFICQSQSLNVHLQAPTASQLTSMVGGVVLNPACATSIPGSTGDPIHARPFTCRAS